MNKTNQLLIAGMLTILGGATSLQAQDLDRITLSAGGDATNQVSYVIGETFNFALADGNITLETGSQGSTENTGGTGGDVTKINNIESKYKVSCYPNPVKETIFFNLQAKDINELTVLIFDINGKLMQTKNTKHTEIMKCDVQELANGTYFLSLANKNGVINGVTKFIKQ